MTNNQEQRLSGIKIVLVEPAGPLNVGAIARIMKNMGLSRLVLVNPQCDPLGTEARQMAVHAIDVLKSAQRVPTLSTALHGCQRAIATTGRDRTTLNIALESPRAALPWFFQPAQGLTDLQECALIFGREDRGLTNEELNLAQRFIRIPASEAYLSLNLAQAVAICCYELYTVAAASEADEGLPTGAIPDPVQANPAQLDQLERYYQHLEALLLKIGYLYPHTAVSRMEKLRRLFNRALPSAEEVAMLRGIVSQMEWCLKQTNTQDR
jgi:tRNA/rRNA methyltransferase